MIELYFIMFKLTFYFLIFLFNFVLFVTFFVFLYHLIYHNVEYYLRYYWDLMGYYYQMLMNYYSQKMMTLLRTFEIHKFIQNLFIHLFFFIIVINNFSIKINYDVIFQSNLKSLILILYSIKLVFFFNLIISLIILNYFQSMCIYSFDLVNLNV